jgi:hypothetical protein
MASWSLLKVTWQRLAQCVEGQFEFTCGQGRWICLAHDGSESQIGPMCMICIGADCCPNAIAVNNASPRRGGHGIVVRVAMQVA